MMLARTLMRACERAAMPRTPQPHAALMDVATQKCFFFFFFRRYAAAARDDAGYQRDSIPRKIYE